MGASGPTIGVFDSGFGGLTVLNALLTSMPGAEYVYLGDTARLPYGSKSRHTVVRYAVESARFLLDQGADHLVVACNTASALALCEIEDAVPVPVTGMIGPGAHAARALGADGHVLVLATAATVHSGAYTRAMAALGLPATEQACPLLVPLVEEGWLDGSKEKMAVTAEVLRIYLEQARQDAPEATALLLGCTHYPLLTPLIEEALSRLGYPLAIVDSAAATALEVARSFSGVSDCATVMRFFATDSVEKFGRLGSRFLGQSLPEVQLVDLGG